MKVAVTCVNNEVFQHFGRCPSFLVCNIENNEVNEAYMVNTPGTGCGVIAGILSQLGVNVVICGGIGNGAKSHLSMYNIEVLPGVSGNAMEQVINYIHGTLEYDPQTECHHHDGNHHCKNKTE